MRIQMSLKKILPPIITGNMLGWYDFSLYGYMASIITKLFFPNMASSLASLILAQTSNLMYQGILVIIAGLIMLGLLPAIKAQTIKEQYSN